MGDDKEGRGRFEAYERIQQLEQQLAEARAAADVSEERFERRLDRVKTETDHLRFDLEQIAYLASHDLQEPLRNVVTMMQLVQRSGAEMDPDQVTQIAVAVEGANRLHGLIHDLLAYTRVVTQGRSPRRCSLGQSLDRATTNLADAIDAVGAEVTNDPLPTVIADVNQMGQLMQNLIANAIKFRSGAPPRVHVAVVQLEDEWQVSVRDNGVGIESAYHDRIFLLLRRPHQTGEYEGSGIGLAICHRIVQRHGGRIWVESNAGEGSTFHFTLPRHAGGPSTA